MTLAADDLTFPTLFLHSLRKDWGVGVLAGEKDGKRRYLFENGQERAFVSSFAQLMERVERPTPEQQLTFARLQGLLAGRAKNGDDGGRPAGFTLSKQLAKFRETYPAGFSDPSWLQDVRGGPNGRIHTALAAAQERLSAKALDSLASNRSPADAWQVVRDVLTASGLVPAAQLVPTHSSGERGLAAAIRELLHGTAAYDKRFDRFVSTFTAALGAQPGWELATALSAVVHPLDHVCVEAAMFKKQLKLVSAQRSVSARPSGSGYATFLSVARLIANKLTEQGEMPRDLMDVRGFIVFTRKPAPEARPKPKAARERLEPPEPADDA
ncbi:MAG TPA: hypothetical protein VGK73_31050 [Polyangiaceae bacterium]